MNTLVRRLIIVVLGLAAVGLVVYLVMNMTSERTGEEAEESTSEVEIKSAPELIEEKKFSLAEVSEEGFSTESYEVPLGGILEIRNNTDREIMFDIRKDNYVAALPITGGQISYSPVFTEAGEYTISEFVDGEFSETIRATVIVK